MTILRLRPSETANSVLDIDYSRLRASGKRCLLFDFDGTLAKHGSPELPSESAKLLRELTGKGFRLGILTNRRRHRVIAGIAIPIIYHAHKPRRLGYVSLLNQLGSEPPNSVMIGDRFITDVLGANRLGIHTIRVRHFPANA